MGDRWRNGNNWAIVVWVGGGRPCEGFFRLAFVPPYSDEVKIDRYWWVWSILGIIIVINIVSNYVAYGPDSLTLPVYFLALAVLGMRKAAITFVKTFEYLVDMRRTIQRNDRSRK